MSHGNFILREPEYEALLSALRKLLVEASAKVVFLVDKNGTLLASAGDAVGFDTTSLASLAAGTSPPPGGSPTSSGRRSSPSSSTRGSGTTCISPSWRSASSS